MDRQKKSKSRHCYVAKKEVQKKGKGFSTRRALDLSEFKELIVRLRKSNNPLKSHTMPGYILYQFNLIARVDGALHYD